MGNKKEVKQNEEKNSSWDKLTPQSRRNIIMMVALVIMFLIGIIVRWDYIKKEVSSSFNRYIDAVQIPSRDSLNNRDSL